MRHPRRITKGDDAMTRTLAAVLASAALVLSPAAARPAQAQGGEELLGLLLGIGTIYAIGKGIEQARAPAQVAEIRPEPIREPHRLAPGHRWTMPARTLPRDCLSTFDTWHGEIRGFDAGCLARAMPRPDRLPPLCAIDTRVGRDYATVYSARCLQLEGWEIERRADAGRYRAPEWLGGSRLAP
jgi:hypothetical protein